MQSLATGVLRMVLCATPKADRITKKLWCKYLNKIKKLIFDKL